MAFACALLLAGPAGAVTIAPGDIADAPPPLCWGGGGCIATPPPPAVFLLDRDTHLKSMLYGPLLVAFSSNGRTPLARYSARFSSHFFRYRGS